jgi:hypothetical protein
MGFIILGQADYLRFAPENRTNTIIACFLTALLEGGIFGGLMYYEYRQSKGNVSQPEYLQFDEERSRQRQSSFKGIALVDMKVPKDVT